MQAIPCFHDGVRYPILQKAVTVQGVSKLLIYCNISKGKMAIVDGRFEQHIDSIVILSDTPLNGYRRRCCPARACRVSPHQMACSIRMLMEDIRPFVARSGGVEHEAQAMGIEDLDGLHLLV